MTDHRSWTKAKRVLAALFLAFLLLFVIRFALGFFVDFDRTFARPRGVGSSLAPTPSGSWTPYDKDVSTNIRELQKMTRPSTGGEEFLAGLGPQAIQKLEVFTREARIESSTEQFEEDRKRAMEAIEARGATVRMQESTGVKPRRSLRLVIRVHEANFDTLVGDLRDVARLASFETVKEDRSEEVRQLYAKANALQDHKQSLIELRSSEAELAGRIQLEERIQQVEREIRQLGVQFGELVQAQPRNNVTFRLTERIAFFVDEQRYPLRARVADALLWTIRWYVLFVAGLAMIYLTVASVGILRSGSDNSA